MQSPSTDAFPFPTAERHDPPTVQPVRPVDHAPCESAIDHGIEESFPASDPVSVNVTRVEPTAPLPPKQNGAARAPLREALRTALIAGGCASVASTVVLAWRGWHDVGSPVAPTNAVSHVLWTDEALGARVPSMRHTALGYAIHHASATAWALLFAWLRAKRKQPETLAQSLVGAGVTAATACAIDYTVTPRRLRPGFEHHLSKGSMAWVYAALAVGLAVGCTLADRGRQR